MYNWLYTVHAHTIKTRTLDRYEEILDNQINKHIGYIQLANLSSTDIQNLMNILIENDYSYGTISGTYRLLNTCFKSGVQKEELIKNPCAGVVLPKNLKKPKKTQFFTEEQIEKIFKECLRKTKVGTLRCKYGYAIIILLYTGMRVGELLGLRWEYVDFESKIIKIEGNLVYAKTRDNSTDARYFMLEQNKPKTASSIREIHINKKVYEALAELKKINPESEFVVINARNKFVFLPNLNHGFKTILERCGIEPCGVHVCRHTFASMLFKKGVDVKTVSELLGHF